MMNNELFLVKKQIELRGYSRRTLQSYLGCLSRYFEFKGKNLRWIDLESIETFIHNQKISPTLASVGGIPRSGIKAFLLC